MKMDHSCVSTKYNWHMTHDNEILKKQKHACFRLQKWMYCCTTHLRNHHTTTKVVDSLYTCSQKPYLSENCIQSTINEKITQSRISMYCLQYFSEVVSLFLPPLVETIPSHKTPVSGYAVTHTIHLLFAPTSIPTHNKSKIKTQSIPERTTHLTLWPGSLIQHIFLLLTPKCIAL